MSPTVSPSPPPPFGPEIFSISAEDLTKEDTISSDEAQVTNCQLVASYNWLNKPNPTIIVPGMPPRWTPPSEPPRLREDSGIFYRDRNALRFPSHPMEPAIESILFTQPSLVTVSPTPIDIVACGSTLGNLFRFATGSDNAFRMLIHVVGSTVHFIRRENSPQETIDDVRGYGHTFPEAYTTWDPDARDSVSHQRIVSYHFGGLRCLVRYEGDGYLPNLAGKLKPAKTHPSSAASSKTDSLDPSLLVNLASTLTTSSISPATPKDSPLTIIPSGISIPQKALFDLKTRSILSRAVDHLAKELPRLYLTQTPNFLLAHHERGVFNEMTTRDVRSRLQEWEAASAEPLCRLAGLLRRIIEIARGREDGRLEITRAEGETVLRLRAQTDGLPGVLSSGCEARWRAWLRGEGDGGDVASKGEDDGQADEGVALW
ncbi:hypothetical protein ACHAQH_003167 [Verticillium albo-atrum]